MGGNCLGHFLDIWAMCLHRQAVVVLKDKTLGRNSAPKAKTNRRLKGEGWEFRKAADANRLQRSAAAACWVYWYCTQTSPVSKSLSCLQSKLKVLRQENGTKSKVRKPSTGPYEISILKNKLAKRKAGKPLCQGWTNSAIDTVTEHSWVSRGIPRLCIKNTKAPLGRDLRC